MSALVRALTVQERDLQHSIHDAAFPDQDEIANRLAWFPASQNGCPASAGSRYVAIIDDAPLGYASVWATGAQSYRLDLLVHPDHRRRGVGASLWDVVCAAASGMGGRRLQARVRSDDEAALGFANRRGFAAVQRMICYRVPLCSVDPEIWRTAKQRLEEQGLTVATLVSERQRNKGALDALFELCRAARLGWPDPDPGPTTETSFVDFERQLSALKRPDTYWIAFDAGRPIGFTCLYGFGTGVHPDYRGRGVGAGLKVYALEQARDDGIAEIDGPSANPAMWSVYKKLGYRETLTEVRLIADLGPTSPLRAAEQAS